MEVSVIIPTFQGERKIGRVLDALSKQTFKSFEVIVAIDGSTDETKLIVERYKPVLSTLVSVEQPNKGRAAIRNKGAAISSGSLLIFYDDDMEPEVDSVGKHVDFHTRFPDSILAGNQVEKFEQTKTDFQNYKAWLTEHWTAPFPEGIKELNEANYFLSAANMSVTKEVFRKLKGFDEQLTDAEDLELASRCFENGVKIFFDKSNMAIHHDTVSCVRYIKRLRQYSQSHQRLKELYPERFENKFQVEIGRRKIFYRIFAVAFWAHLTDKNSFAWLPKTMRYKIYGAILHSLGKVYPNVSI